MSCESGVEVVYTAVLARLPVTLSVQVEIILVNCLNDTIVHSALFLTWVFKTGAGLTV